MASKLTSLSPRLRGGLAIVASAGMTALAAPAVGLSPLALIALAPLVWAVTTARTWRAALAVGVLASMATGALLYHWLPGSLNAFFGFPIAASWAVFPFYAAVAQPQLVLWAVARWRLRHHTDARALVASAALYAGLDWALPKLFHDTLGVSFYADRWAIQVADLGGLYALTFAAVLVAEVACAVVIFRRRSVGAAVTAGVVWAAILGYGALRSRQIEAQTAAAPSFIAGVAQANIGNIEKEIAKRGDLDAIVDTLAAYGKLSEQLVVDLPAGVARPDGVIWPETAYPLAYGAHRSPVDDDMDRELSTWAQKRQVPLLFGGYRREGGTEFNSAILLDSAGEVQAYHKFHLIPFGEYIPLLGRAKFGTGGSPRVLNLAVARPQGAGAAPAPSAPTAATAAQAPLTARLGPIICYESLIPSHAAAAVRAGAQALVNLTNDSWFVSTAEKKLHLAMAAVRSVETRRAQLRATNTGISVLILPNGQLREPGPVDAAAALRYQVPLLDSEPTLCVRGGVWTGPACLLLSLLALVLGRRKR